jgi:hypothetical protein
LDFLWASSPLLLRMDDGLGLPNARADILLRPLPPWKENTPAALPPAVLVDIAAGVSAACVGGLRSRFAAAAGGAEVWEGVPRSSSSSSNSAACIYIQLNLDNGKRDIKFRTLQWKEITKVSGNS